MGELRNISCTPLLSKIIEHFALRRLKEEVYPDTNQFGGLTGCGTTHYLIEAWDEILESMDQENAASCLVFIDFAKAFNTMSHQSCLKALLDHGASTHITRIVGSFFMNRTMTFRVGDSFSSPRPLKGGSPQGTLLGNFLFVMATNKLEHPSINDPSYPCANDDDLDTNPPLMTTSNKREWRPMADGSPADYVQSGENVRPIRPGYFLVSG